MNPKERIDPFRVRTVKNFALVCLLLLAGSGLPGQEAADLNEGSRLQPGTAADSLQLSWWGRPGVTYFVQSSENLLDWKFFRLVEPGNAGIAAWGFGTNADGLFLRLVSTEEPTLDPWNEDFDGDGLGSYDELLLGLHPLEEAEALEPAADDDGDGVTNGEDALPNDPTVGELSVSIEFPSAGGLVQ